MADAQQMFQKFSKSPKVEPVNALIKAPKAPKLSSELMSRVIKNLDQELAEHEKLYKKVEADIELKLKEAID